MGKSNNGESDWSEKRQVEMGKDSSEEERYLFWARSCRVARNNGPNGDGYLVVVSSLVHTTPIWLDGYGMGHDPLPRGKIRDLQFMANMLSFYSHRDSLQVHVRGYCRW